MPLTRAMKKNQLLAASSRILEEQIQLLSASTEMRGRLMDICQHIIETSVEYTNFLEQHSALLVTPSCGSRLGRQLAKMRLEVHGEQAEELNLRRTCLDREREGLKVEIERLDREEQLLNKRIKVVREELDTSINKSSCLS